MIYFATGFNFPLDLDLSWYCVFYGNSRENIWMDEMDTDGPKRHKAYSFDAKTVLSWDGNGCKESSKNELLMGVKKNKTKHCSWDNYNHKKLSAQVEHEIKNQHCRREQVLGGFPWQTKSTVMKRELIHRVEEMERKHMAIQQSSWNDYPTAWRFIKWLSVSIDITFLHHALINQDKYYTSLPRDLTVALSICCYSEAIIINSSAIFYPLVVFISF